MTNEQGWKETLEDLDLRRERSRAMGGPERLAKHHGKGKLDARARLDHLLDKGTFREFGTLVGGEVAADGIVAGSGLIDGSPVMVGAEDFTTLAGSIGPGGNSKRYRLAELALRDRIPLVMLLEGAGFRPSGEHYGRTPTDLLAQAQCSGKVPMVGGPARPVGRARRAGGAGVRLHHHEPPGRDLHRGSAGRERVDRRGDFEGGPRRAARRPGQRRDPQRRRRRRGGARRHPPVPVVLPVERVVVSAVAPDDEASEPRSTPELLDIVPRDNRRVYDMRAVLDVVFDDRGWFEVQPKFGPAMICALAHLGGHPVAVVANQPQVLAGSIDADAADKAAHFITVADSFHLPIVFLADNPGMLPGSRSERTGVLRSGARMFAAQTAATTLKLHVTLRKAYGFGSMVMSLLGFDDQVATFAYPGATMGAMSAAALSGPRTPTRTSRPSCARRSCRRRTGRPAPRVRRADRPGRDAQRPADALQRGIYSRQAAAEPV